MRPHILLKRKDWKSCFKISFIPRSRVFLPINQEYVISRCYFKLKHFASHHCKQFTPNETRLRESSHNDRQTTEIRFQWILSTGIKAYPKGILTRHNLITTISHNMSNNLQRLSMSARLKMEGIRLTSIIKMGVKKMIKNKRKNKLEGDGSDMNNFMRKGIRHF